jgi:hypothetical protein
LSSIFLSIPTFLWGGSPVLLFELASALPHKAWVISHYPIRYIAIYISQYVIYVRGVQVFIIFVVGALSSIQADMCHVGHEGLGSSNLHHHLCENPV